MNPNFASVLGKDDIFFCLQERLLEEGGVRPRSRRRKGVDHSGEWRNESGTETILNFSLRLIDPPF
jgi:hypothetical protein